MIFLSHRDLASLVEKARKGDETAFQKIYEHTANVQLFQIRQIIDDPEEAQDALQETYFLLYQNLDKVDPLSLVAYLNRLSYYTSKNMRKTTGRFQRRITDIKEAEALNASDGIPHRQIENQENAQIIKDAFCGLPNQEQLLLSMKYIQKQPLKQIAYALGVSVSTVKRLQNTAKNHLMENLKSQGHFILFPLGSLLKSQLKETLEAQPVPDYSVPQNSGNKMLQGDVPRPAKISSPFSAGALASAKGVAAAVSLSGAVFVGAAAVSSDLTVENISVPQDYVSSPAEVQIQVNSLLPVKNVFLTSQDGQKTAGIHQSDNNYLIEVYANGTYQLTAENTGGRSAKQTVDIHCIDTAAPAASGILKKDGITIVSLSDEETGILYDSVYCISEKGTITYPLRYDEKAGSVSFRLPAENNQLYFADQAGNVSCTELKLRSGAE